MIEKPEETFVDRVEFRQESGARLEEGNDASNTLKKTKGGIVLEPQPSDDVHDPLDFSKWEKGFLGLESSIPILQLILRLFKSPTFFMMIDHYHISLDLAAYSVNGPLVAYGIGCLIWVPVGNRIGSRLCFLVSSFGAATLTIWAALAPTFSQFVAARVLAALFYASPEAYGPQIVGDTFFLHQRATATGIFTAFQFSGFTFASFIGGFAALNHGWTAPSWVMVIMTYVSFLLLVLFFPETSYTRDYNRLLRNRGQRGYIDMLKLNASSGGGPPKSANLWGSFLAPWKYLVQSRVLLATTYFSLVLATNDYLLTTNSISFPLVYGFTLRDVALTSFAPTLGNLLGIILGGYLNDKYVLWQKKRPNGHFSPEMRLPMAVFTAIIGPAGLVLFGTATQEHRHWIAPLFGEFMVNFLAVVAGNIIYTYMAETYLQHADSALVMLNALKNFAAFGIVYAVTPWNTHSGYTAAFGCLAAILFVAHIPVVLLYYKGPLLSSKGH
ncbi:hypothetical protein G7046_g8592 [Stylonectria norvegica]|nr:hypothetical protein G7046_g8592 [Stylonectria norvegica]